jgi:hypothetical protein
LPTTPGGAETIVLTYGYWQRRLGSDSQVIGRVITVDSRPREVIGVMSRGEFACTADIRGSPHALAGCFDRAAITGGASLFPACARIVETE